MALIALITWWSCSAFIPVVASALASDVSAGDAPAGVAALRARFITIGSTAFNLGGLVGTLITVPVALWLGRRKMFLLYFTASALAIFTTFGLSHSPETRLYAMFSVGLTVFGVFGSFSFYLPELFPARLRGTGSGFCYNAGRILTAAFPFAVGWVVRSGKDPLDVLSYVALVPIVGAVLVLVGIAPETAEPDTAPK